MLAYSETRKQITKVRCLALQKVIDVTCKIIRRIVFAEKSFEEFFDKNPDILETVHFLESAFVRPSRWQIVCLKNVLSFKLFTVARRTFRLAD